MRYRPPGPYEGTAGVCDDCSRTIAAGREVEIRLAVDGRSRTRWQFCSTDCKDGFLHRAGTHSHGDRDRQHPLPADGPSGLIGF